MNIERFENKFLSSVNDFDRVSAASQEIHSSLLLQTTTASRIASDNSLYYELNIVIHRVNQLNFSNQFLTKQIANDIISDLVRLIPQKNDELLTKFSWLILNFLNRQTIILENDVENVSEYFLKALKEVPISALNLSTVVLYLRTLATLLYGNVQRLKSMHGKIIGDLQQVSHSMTPVLLGGNLQKVDELSFLCASAQCLENLSAGDENSPSYLSTEHQKMVAQNFLHTLQKIKNMNCIDDNLYYKTVTSCFKGLKNIMEVSRTFPNDLVGHLVTVVLYYSVLGHFQTSRTDDTLRQLAPGKMHISEISAEVSGQVEVPSIAHGYPEGASVLDPCSSANVKSDAMRFGQHQQPSTPQQIKNKNKRRPKMTNKGTTSRAKEQDSDEEHKRHLSNVGDDLSRSPAVASNRPISSEDEKFWSTFGVSDSSDLSDVEMNQSFSRSSNNNFSAKIRVQALTLFHIAVKCGDRKTMFGHWQSIIPDRFISHSSQLKNYPLFAIIVKDPSHKMRLAALSILTSLLEGSKQFLMAAEDGDQYHNVAYTPFSVNLGNMVKEFHRCLLLTLTKEQVSVVLVQAVKCLGMLVASSPYHRLKPGLLSRLVKSVKTFLFHKDANLKVVALTCMGSVVSVHAPLAEVIHLLISRPSKVSTSLMLEFSQQKEGGKDQPGAESGFSSGHDEYDVKITLSSGVSSASCSGPGTPSNSRLDHSFNLQSDETVHAEEAAGQKCNTGSSDTSLQDDNLTSRQMSWLLKVCIEIVLSGCKKNRRLATPTPSGSSIPPPDSGPNVSPGELSYIHVVPVRVEALQLLTLLAQNYFAVVRPHLVAIQSVSGNCLYNDSDNSIQLHAIKLLEALTASVSSSQSTNSFTHVPVDEALKLWNFILSGPIQKALSNNMDSMVEMAACECLGNIGPCVFALLPDKDAQFIKNIMLGFASVTSHHICIGALSAIGRSVTYPCMSNDAFFLADASNSVIRALKMNNLGVITKAAWVLSNLSDALVLNRLDEEFIANISDGLLLKLLENSINLCSTHDKPRSNALRTIGNLLNYLPSPYLDTGKFNDIIKNSFQTIIKYISSGSVKVRWNACYAFGNIMWNEPVLSIISHKMSEAYSALVRAVKTCRNFKVRISAATVLAIPTRREMFFQGDESKTSAGLWSSVTSHKKFVMNRTDSENCMSSVHYYRFTMKDHREFRHYAPGVYVMKVDVETEFGMMQSETKKVGCQEDCFGTVWSGVLSALLECESTSIDFVEMKYRSTLVLRLIGTLIHLLSLVVPGDLALCYKSLSGNEEKIKGYMRKQDDEVQTNDKEIDNQHIKTGDDIKKLSRHFKEISKCTTLTDDHHSYIEFLSTIFIQSAPVEDDTDNSAVESNFFRLYD